jgi:hypothetical protein
MTTPSDLGRQRGLVGSAYVSYYPRPAGTGQGSE